MSGVKHIQLFPSEQSVVETKDLRTDDFVISVDDIEELVVVAVLVQTIVYILQGGSVLFAPD